MLTGVIAIVVTSVKFVAGAYLVVILIPTLVGMMLFIRRQYAAQAAELAVRDDLVFDRPHRKQRVVIPVNGINRSVVQAVMFGKSLVDDPSMLQAVFVTTDLEEAEALRLRWERQLPGVPLVVVESPYRALVGPRRDLPRRARARLAAGPGGADDDRRAARVRRPPLVGPAALQPGGQAPEGGARGPRAHGDRGRPVPAERAPRASAGPSPRRPTRSRGSRPWQRHPRRARWYRGRADDAPMGSPAPAAPRFHS